MINSGSEADFDFVNLILSVLPNLIIFILSTCVIIIGWFVIYRNAKKLASRAEIRGHLAIFDSCFEDLCKSAIEYYFDSISIDEASAHDKKTFPIKVHELNFIQNSTTICHKALKISNYLKSYEFCSDEMVQGVNLIRQHITNPPTFASGSEGQVLFAAAFWPWYQKLSELCNHSSSAQHERFVSFFLNKTKKKS